MLKDDIRRVWQVLKSDISNVEKAEKLNMSECEYQKVVGEMFKTPEVIFFS